MPSGAADQPSVLPGISPHRQREYEPGRDYRALPARFPHLSQRRTAVAECRCPGNTEKRISPCPDHPRGCESILGLRRSSTAGSNQDTEETKLAHTAGLLYGSALLGGYFGGLIGGVDMQNVLPFGTVKEVEEEVTLRIRQAGYGGGFIIASVEATFSAQPDRSAVTTCP